MVSFENIESSNEVGKFGGWYKICINVVFGWIVFVVVCMCMLEVVGVKWDLWLMLSCNIDSRNRVKL